MKVTRLHLRDFKRHADLTVEPAPGLTVIRGPNEAGKTTIQRALELALFRRVTSQDGEMRDGQRWGASDQQMPSIELDFEADGAKGRLSKAFRGPRGAVELAIGDEKTNDPATADTWISELTGIPNEKFFRSTASVRHHEVMDLDHDEATLRDRLQQSISGADRGISRAKRRLDEAIRANRAAGVKNPGPLKRSEDDRARLAETVMRGEEGLARLERDREAHVQATARRAAADVAFAGTREELEQAELAVRLAREKSEGERRYEQLRAAAELRGEIADLDAKHPAGVPLESLRGHVEELRRLGVTIAECNAALAAEDSLMELRRREPRWRPQFLAGNLLVYGGLILLGAQAWARVLRLGPSISEAPLITLVGTVVVVIGALTLLVAYRRRREAERIMAGSQLKGSTIERRLRGRGDTEERLLASQRRTKEILDQLGKTTLPEAETLLAAEDQHVREIQLREARFKELMRGEDLPDIGAARDEAAAEVERKAAALAGMGEIGRDPAGSRDRFDARMRTHQLERDSAMREEAATGERVQQNQVDALEVAAASEQLAQATERLEALQRRLRVYELALSALNDAEQATMKKATAFLEERMGADIDRITGGRYQKVQVHDELDIDVWSPERADWVPVEALSQGTVDQVYLAARIELVRLVTQDRRPPLIFDDPFVTYDDDRARRAVELLRGLAADHQILYLTTSDRYDSVADKVIALPPPDGLAKGP